METLGKDLFLHTCKWYLVVAEYYSKCLWVQKFSATSTMDVVSSLSVCLSIFGTSEEVIFNNGTQLTSKK